MRGSKRRVLVKNTPEQALKRDVLSKTCPGVCYVALLFRGVSLAFVNGFDVVGRAYSQDNA